MKFMLTYALPPATRDEAIARFLETRSQPPPGVTLLGRWTQCDLCGGFVLVESEDPQALTAFAHAWSDLLDLTLTPVLEDQALSDVLERAPGPGRVERKRTRQCPQRRTLKTRLWRPKPRPGRLNRHTKRSREPGFCRKFSFDSIWGMISLCHDGL